MMGVLLFMAASEDIIKHRLDPGVAGDSMLARVRIADFPKRTGKSVAFRVEPLHDNRLPPRSRVTWMSPKPMPRFGDVWDLELRLRRPRGNSVPGGFSTEDWMFRERLHASGYVVAGKRNRLILVDQLSPVETIRRDIVSRLVKTAPDAAPTLAAIGVGARHLLTADQWDVFAATGTAHLMAISGLHIGLAAGLAFVLFGPLMGLLRLPVNYRDAATIAAIIVAIAYAVLAGLAIPAQRATLMLMLAALALLKRRCILPSRVIALSAVAIFIVDPIAILAPGYALSFAAVAVLLFSAARYSPARRLPAITLLARAQAVLFFALLPLTVLYFQRLSLSAPIVNFVAVPIFSLLVVPALLASLVLQPFSSFASAAMLAASASVLQWITTGLQWAASWPGGLQEITGAGGFRPLLIVVLPTVLWTLLPSGWPGRSLAMVALLGLLLNTPAPPPRGCLRMHTVDIGQGLAVLLQGRDHTVIYDTGPSYRTGGSAAERLLIPFLKNLGISRVDVLVVSHADDDHAGGAAALLEEFDVGAVYRGEPTSPRDIACAAGQHFILDDISYRFVYPSSAAHRVGNDASCVLLIEIGAHTIILTGDIERQGEAELVRSRHFSRVDVAVIPHHGSLTSSDPALVRRLRPRIALVAAGFGNRWNLPNQRIVARWQAAGATVINTASSGTTSVDVCAEGGIRRIRRDRQVRRRFWHDP